MRWSYLYVLDENNNPVAEPDLNKWSDWFERTDRHVGDETIGESRVSTVFLAINYAKEGNPKLWETMVFGGKLDQNRTQCAGSREQAEAMHAQMIAKVRKAEQA